MNTTNATNGVRHLCLLLIVLATGHAIVHGVQALVMQRLMRSQGLVGFDDEGRVRHWCEENFGRITFLSAETVKAPGETTDDQSGTERDARIVVRAGARPPRAWRGTRFPFPGAAAYEGDSLHSVQLFRGPNELWIRRAGERAATFWLPRWTGDAPEHRGRESGNPIAGDFAWPPEIFAAEASDGPDLACVVNDEYWIVDRNGEFVQRDRLPIDRSPGSPIEYAWGEGDTRMLLVPGGACHPDSIPLRAILLRRGHEPLLRDLTLEPVTRGQRALDATWAILAALRPLPLNALATTRPAPTDANRMLNSPWSDAYFAGRAHLSWLWLNALVALASALLAFRSVRIRCESRRERGFWIAAAALLGPFGLVWMRMSIPWFAIVDGRAVNRGDWGLPASTGREVFA